MKWYAVFSIAVVVFISCVGCVFAQSQSFEMGMKEFRDENYEEALVYFLEARKAEPTSSTVAFYVGLTYKIMEQHKVNQLLVVDAEQKLIGALNMHDLFRAKVI